MKPDRRPSVIGLAALLAAAFALAGCGDGGSARADSGQPAPVAMARGVVEVDGGLVRVPAIAAGRVVRVAVHEGDHVDQGALLAALDDREAALKVAAAEAVLKSRQAAAAIAAAHEAAARKLADRLARLAAADAASAQEASDAATASAAASAESAAAAAAAAEAEAAVHLAELDAEARTLSAPVAGLVLKQAITEGDYLRPDDDAPPFILAPDRPRVVNAELDEAFAAQVTIGMSAAILDDANPGAPPQAARVIRMSAAIEAAALVAAGDQRIDQRVLRVTLEIDQNAGLRLGERVTVRFGP